MRFCLNSEKSAMEIHKHIYINSFAILILAISASGSVALESTRTVVKEWVATEKAISSEAILWEEAHTLLNDLTQVTQAEIATLNQSLNKIAATTTRAEALRIKLVTEQQALQTARQQISNFLTEIEPQLTALRPALPAPLNTKLTSLFQRIPNDSSNTTLGIAERMQTIVGILNTINKFDRAITVHEEIRTLGDGSQGEVESVYVGLGVAYYRTRSGDDAGYGQPHISGWQWNSQPELSAAIAEVIAITNNSAQEARFIALPVELQN
ncbi:MAG: DUF3450 family protein [Opitutae bacterium]|nr:DUF3450 family protein [Opitutae bacterium]